MAERRRNAHPYHHQSGVSAATSPVSPSKATASLIGVSAHQPQHQPQQQQQQHGRTPAAPSLGLWSSRALLLVVASIYSTNFATVKYLEQYCAQPPCKSSDATEPSQAAFCRFLVSATVCVPILYYNRHHNIRTMIKCGMECGFCMCINYFCQAEALEYIPAGKCAFIGALAVVTVPIFASIFMKKVMQPMNFVSAGIALIGVAILENVMPGFSGQSTVTSSSPSSFLGKGDLLALGQPIGFGYGVMKIDHYLEKHSNVPNHVLTMTAAQCVTVCALTFIWVLYDEVSETGTVTTLDISYMFLESHRLIALIWTGIVTTVFATVLQGVALQKASATDAALIFSTEPVWGSLFAGWLLEEKLSPTTYVGGAFILVACILGSLSDAAQHTRPADFTKKRLKSKMSSDNIQYNRTVDIPASPNNNDSIPSLTDVRHYPLTRRNGGTSATAKKTIPVDQGMAAV